MIAHWITAGATTVAAILLSNVLARVTRHVLTRSPVEAAREHAGTAAKLVSTIVVLVGLVAAVGILSPAALAPIPADLARFLPRAVLAIVLIIGGKIVAELASAAVGRASLKATGRQPAALVKVVGLSIVAVSVLLAVRQIGIDTRVLDILVTAVVFSTALSLALLVGVGGSSTAAELAAGRTLRHHLAPGMTVLYRGERATIERLDTTMAVLRTDTATRIVRLTHLLDDDITIPNSPVEH
jgi:hypothetical protein